MSLLYYAIPWSLCGITALLWSAPVIDSHPYPHEWMRRVDRVAAVVLGPIGLLLAGLVALTDGKRRAKG